MPSLPPSPTYLAALDALVRALQHLARGDRPRADALLETLDVGALEVERQTIQQFVSAATSHPMHGRGAPRPPIRAAEKRAVAARDGWRCRYTGRPLVHPSVFRELGRVTTAFVYDEHHAVRPTRRGPAGHPVVRTHAAAFDHVRALATGGAHATDNLVLTSVELNEAKNTRHMQPELLVAQSDGWTGLAEYLPMLRALPTVGTPRGRDPQPHREPRPGNPVPAAPPGGPAAATQGSAAFASFWSALVAEFEAHVPLIFGPRTGNPRKIVAISEDGMTLRELTGRGGTSTCDRATLAREFEQLAADSTWRTLPARAVRERFGIANWIEFKRALFERYERSSEPGGESPGRGGAR